MRWGNVCLKLGCMGGLLAIGPFLGGLYTLLAWGWVPAFRKVGAPFSTLPCLSCWMAGRPTVAW